MSNKDWNESLTVLFERMLNSEQDAFNEVYNHYKDGMIRYAYSIVENLADAQDVYQAAMTYIFSHLEQIIEPRAMSGYIRSTVYTRALNLKNSKERIHIVQDVAESGKGYLDTASDGKTPETILSEYLRRELLNMLLAELDEKYLTILVMANINGLSAKKIAAKFDLRLSTVTGRLAYAKNKLAAIAEKYTEMLAE